MLIQENNLTFKGKFDIRERTDCIVLHHSDSGPKTTIADIHGWHLNRGWAGLGYHYVIYSDGTIYRGRPEWAKGAHAYQDPMHEANSDGIGICLIGNFMQTRPTEAQMNSLIWLIGDIRTRHSGKPVIGHKDVMPTSCPGDLFPWDELKKKLKGGPIVEQWKLNILAEAKNEGLTTTDHNPDEPATKWFVLQIALNLLKMIRKG